MSRRAIVELVARQSNVLSSAMAHWDLAFIVALLAIAIPWMGRRRIQQLMRIPRTDRIERLTIYASTMALQWSLAVIIFWRITADGISTRRLGLELPRPLLIGAVGVGLVAVVFANQLLSLRRLKTSAVEPRSMLVQLALKVFPQDTAERLAFSALVLTAAFCEEWIYRGFVQRMFEDWGRSVAAGIIGSAVLFAAAHVYQGRRGLLSTFAVGLIFSTVRFWTGSLVPSVAAHFVADLTAGYLSPALVREALRQQHGASGEDGPGV